MATTIPAGFANADNTGVPSGTVLTAYTGPTTIMTDGTVIENKIINGALDVYGNNVTIKNCIITYNDFFGIDARGLNITVENCTIIGPGNNGDSPAVINADVGGVTLINNNISGGEHAIALGTGSAVISGNYIHDGGSSKGDAAHIGGISLKGGQANVLIENNTVVLGSYATSDVFLQNNFGPISNVTINHNFLGGDPGYNIYVEGRLSGGPVTNISVTNNVLVRGVYGDYAFTDASPTVSGNVVFPEGTVVTSDPTSTTPPASTPPSAPTIASFSQDSGVVGDNITNDNALTLTGSAVANSTVKVFDGSTQIGTATANSSGAWSYTTAALSDGSHNLTATATNASSQTSTASTTLAVKIDTTAPNAPTIGTPTSNAGGGVNLTGTAEANSTVKVFDGATQIGTATANGSGAWSYATAALTTGSHSFTVKATDAAGNTGAASAAAVATIAAPTAAPSAPTIASFSSDSGVVGDGITNDRTLTLTGTAAANGTVTVFDGATQIGTATANVSGAWSYTTSALSDGSHNLTATVTNASGQTSTASAALAAKIDATAPNAPTIGTVSNNVSGGANLATLAAASSTVDTGGGVNLTGTAEANSTVKVFDGNNQIGAAAANGSGVWSYTTAALTTGSHSFTAEAMDAAGNTGAASAAVAVNIAAPAPSAPGAPAIASFSNDSGVVGDHITNDNTLTLTGTAAANSSVKVFDGSTQVGTATANSSGAWSLTTTALVDGSHSLTATTTTQTSGPNPTVFEDFNPWSGNVSPDGIWRIAGTWTGTGGNTLQPGNVSFTNTYPGETDTGFMYLTVPAGSPLRGAELQSLTTPGYSYGYYEARIKTTDVKGGGVVSFFWIEQPNYGSHEWDVEFTLSDSWAGTTNPGRVSFTTHPLDNTQWVNLGFNPSQGFHDYGFLWTPGRIDFTVDGQIVRTVTDANLKTDALGYIMMNTWSGVSNFGGGPPSQDATSVYDWVKFYAGATSIPVDSGSTGGSTSTSTPLSVTIDTAAPSAPTIAASTSPDTLASTHVEVLTGTAEANSTVTVFDGMTKLGTAVAGSNGAWSYTTAALSTGSHSFTAKAMDAAGNTGAASAAVVANISSAPAVPKISSFSDDTGVAGDGITGDNTLTLAGTAAANSTVKIFDNSTQIGTATAKADGSWDYITSILTDAKHMLTATATDASGQASAASSALAVTVDTKAPVAPTIASDTVNSTNQVVVSGTAEANSTLKVYDGTTLVGTTTTDATGNWTVTSSPLSIGAHALTATATDAAGNTSAVSSPVNPAIGTAIESAGSTSLTQVGSHYDLNNGGSGPELKIGAAAVVAGQTSIWTPIGAEQTANGYEVAWKVAGADQYMIWSTDSNGTYISSVQGTGVAIASFETSFHQDLNGDGVIGVPSTVIESFGSTSLTQVGNNYNLYAGGSGPSLKIDGATVVAGQTSIWTPIGAEHTATGYEVAWKVAGADHYMIWNTDSNGTYINSVQGTGVEIASFETSFHQDLNGDGTIGVPATNAPASAVELTDISKSSLGIVTLKGTADASSDVQILDGTNVVGTVTSANDGTWTYASSSAVSNTVHTFTAQELDGTGHVVASSGSAFLGSTGGNTLTSTAGNDLFVGNGSHDTFVFAQNFGKDVINDFSAGSRGHDVIQFSTSVFDSFASVLAHATQVGQDVVIAADATDSLTLKNVKLAALDNTDFHFA